MKIECKLQRKGGSHIEIGGTTYHFAPQEDGRHVAEVTNERHIERFLSIPEGYGLLRTPGADAAEELVPNAAPAPVAAPQEIRAAEGVLIGSDQFPATVTIGERTYQLGEVVARAFSDSGLTEIEWNEQTDETRAIKIEMVLDGIEDGEITLPLPVPAAHTPAPGGNAEHTPAPVEKPAKPARVKRAAKSTENDQAPATEKPAE